MIRFGMLGTELAETDHAGFGVCYACWIAQQPTCSSALVTSPTSFTILDGCQLRLSVETE